MKRCFGIDLGTTNSVISCLAVQDDGTKQEPYAIEIAQFATSTAVAQRTKTLPSFVYYGNDQQVIVGEYAQKQYSLMPERVAKSIKSQMGAFSVAGLSDTVPDKTPEAISARILAHLRTQAARELRMKEISTAVIAVPANFSLAAKEATLEAARLAGFTIPDDDKKWILISEPNAVLYDAAQRYLSSGVCDSGIDFSKRQRVIVFDMGGGTLDVTFQEVTPAATGRGLDISEIASARYNRMAGDLFDSWAARAVFNRFTKRIRDVNEMVFQDVMGRRERVLSYLVPAAERLKIDCNALAGRAQEEQTDSWFQDAVETASSADVSVDVGNDSLITDSVKPEEYYEMIRPLLGEGLKYADYRNYALAPGAPSNIITPLLDVLAKADHYYSTNGEAMEVDAVILNGGMCKLHWVQERLRDFFGFAPVMTSDPAVSVANGAAVYASLLEELRQAEQPEAQIAPQPVEAAPSIRVTRRVQNEDLYLSLSAGARFKLISAQDTLPHNVELKGFEMYPDSSFLQLPILQQTDQDHDTAYTAIARCALSLQPAKKPQKATKGKKTKGAANDGKNGKFTVPVSLQVGFDRSGLLSVDVQRGEGRDCLRRSAVFELKGEDRRGDKLLPCQGSILNPANELRALQDCFTEKAIKDGRANMRVHIIKQCGNPRDFEQPVLRELEKENVFGRYRLFVYYIAYGLLEQWTKEGRARLEAQCKRDAAMLSRRDRQGSLAEVIPKIQTALRGLRVE